MRNMAIVVAVLLSTNAHAGAADNQPKPVASPDWLALTYDVNFNSPYYVSEQREKALYGWRASTQLSVIPHFFLWGSYDYQLYDTTDDTTGYVVYTRERYAHEKYGGGFQVPLLSATLQAQVSWQQLMSKLYLEIPGVGSGHGNQAARGFGYLAGLRVPLAGGAELWASYEIAPLKAEEPGMTLKEKFRTTCLQLTAPLTRRIGLVLALEQAHYSDTFVEQEILFENNNENALIGLRFAL